MTFYFVSKSLPASIVIDADDEDQAHSILTEIIGYNVGDGWYIDDDSDEDPMISEAEQDMEDINSAFPED